MNLCACVLPVAPGCPEENARRMIAFMDAHPAEIYLFPAFALTGVSCGALFSRQSFIDRTDRAADRLCDYTETHPVTVVTSLNQLGNVYFRHGSLSRSSRFDWNGKTVAVSDTGEGKADILLLPICMASYPCIEADVAEFCAKASGGCTVAVANPGFGEGVAEGVYRGMCGVFRDGREVAFRVQDAPADCFVSGDGAGTEVFPRTTLGDVRVPYYGKNPPAVYLSGLQELQVQALYTRLRSSGREKIGLRLPPCPEALCAFLAAEGALSLAGLPASALTVADTTAETAAFARARGATVGEMCEDEQLLVGFESFTSAALGLSGLCASVCHYNICASLPRTLITALLRQKATVDEAVAAFAGLLTDGETDVLTDFILYYAARHKLEPAQVQNYCLATFDEFDDDTVERAVERVFAGLDGARLRRGLTCEGANITDVTLPYIPVEAKNN